MLELNGQHLRPLLSLSKEKLRKYMIAQSAAWKEDWSNFSKRYKRNKIRIELLPLLSEIAGSKEALERRLLVLTDQSDEIANYFETQVSFFFQFQFLSGHFQPQL